MKRFKISPAQILLCAALCFPALVPYAAAGVQVTARQGGSLYLYNDYYALVVGVGNYTNGWPALPGALKDSEDVAAALKDYGFAVKLVKNPTSRDLKKAVTEMAFVTGKEPNRALLLYFAGHGETLNLADGTKLGYIIPADCPLKDRDPMGFDDLAISMKEMEALALKVQCKHVLMMFDSCFSGALFNLVRAAPVEISEKSVTPVRQFITAGEEGEQVPDKSVFKQVFLDGIRSDADLNNDGYVTGSELGMYLQTKVVNYSRGGQHPQYGKINNPRLDKGDFIFVPKATRQQQEQEIKKADSERTAVSEELKRLQEERRKNEELMEKLKQLLEARIQTEEAQKKRSLEEQKDLEQKLKQAEKEKQASSTEAEEKIRRLEAERKATAERMDKEAADRKALEEEVRRLRAESRKTSQAVAEMAARKTEEVKVASIPKEVARPEPARPAQAESGLKVAIFPMYATASKMEDKNRPMLMKNILVTVDTADAFKEIYSYYSVENRPDIQVVGQELGRKEIWKRKNVFSDMEPDVDLFCAAGKKLGVDAVFAFSVDGDRSYMYYTIYLIDVAKKKAYSNKVSHPRGSGAPGQEVRIIAQKTLDEYRKGR
ncbi:MAG: caspase family protein [Thermodesulfobacteriota bacterium]